MTAVFSRPWATVFVGAALLAAACGPRAEAPAPGSSQQPAAPPAATSAPTTGAPAPAVAAKAKTGNILHSAVIGAPPHFDPSMTSYHALHSTGGVMYLALLSFNMGPDVDSLKSEVVPELAERWEQPDEKTYIFHLRKGVKWHNVAPAHGREFNADDVIYSYNRLVTVEGRTFASYLAPMEKIEKLDDYTIKTTLKAPSASWLSALAYGDIKIVNKEAVEAGGGNLKNGPFVGLGAFMPTKMDIKTGFVFKRNPDFYQKDANGVQLPYLDGITFPLITDETVRLTAFRTRQLDLLSAGSQAQAEPVLKQSPEVKKLVTRTWGATNEAMNNNHPALKDKRVRLAISKAINRKEIIDTAWLGDGWTNQAIPLPGLDWMIPQAEFEKAYVQDVPAAKKLLAEAGFADGFTCPIKVAQGFGESYIKQGELIQSYLKQININAPLVMLGEQAQWVEGILGRGDFECMATGPQPGQNEADLYLSSNLHSKGSRNISKVNDPKLDQLIEAQSREINPEKRKAVLLDIQRMILDNMYVISVRGGTSTQLLWPYVHNFSPSNDRAGRFYRSMWLDPDDAAWKQRPAN